MWLDCVRMSLAQQWKTGTSQANDSGLLQPFFAMLG
jgi:hypothetical protein